MELYLAKNGTCTKGLHIYLISFRGDTKPCAREESGATRLMPSITTTTMSLPNTSGVPPIREDPRPARKVARACRVWNDGLQRDDIGRLVAYRIDSRVASLAVVI